MPDRRSGAGRRRGEEAKPVEKPTDPPKPPVEQRVEVEPDRRHFLHRKVGGKPKVA